MPDELFERAQKLCEERVADLFDPTQFEIAGVYAGIDWETKQPYCVVDFRRKGWTADVECSSYCRDAIEYFAYEECEEGDEECWEKLEKECIEECEDNVKKILTGSIEFDPVTLRVKSATIPTDCEHVWGSEEMSTEEFEEMEEEMRKNIRMYGCEPEKVNWIHPHEIIPIETPELGYEEYPAMCYYHVAVCSLRSVIRLMEEGVL